MYEGFPIFIADNIIIFILQLKEKKTLDLHAKWNKQEKHKF